MEAYSLLLRANYLLTKGGGSEDELRKATDYYQQAVQLDPTSAPAWAGLSRGLAELTFTQPWKQVRQRAFDAANRALSLNPSLADAHIALAKDYFYDWDWVNADAQFKQARALEPTNFSAFLLSGRLFSALRRKSEVLQYLQEASARDPLNWAPYTEFGFEYEYQGRFTEAEASFRKAEQLAPTIDFTGLIGFMHVRAGGDPDAALAEINRAVDASDRAFYLAASYPILGRRADADAALARYQKDYSATYPYSMALLHAWRAESKEAFAWLDRAYQQHDISLIWIKTAPAFEKFRSDPRFKTFLRKMNLPE
jgi:tetratricopeptide (TPR) repeat protein